MKSNFSFENLKRRLPKICIPKEFIYSGIGMAFLILIGLIVSNMYLQEMLFLEGQEKSIQLFTEEELREYGSIYKEMSLDFENEIGYIIEDYANRTNRAEERIHYGVYNHEHTTDDTGKIKIHTNGLNINSADDGHISDFNDSFNNFNIIDSYVYSDEFKNGVDIKYSKTNGRQDGESNYQDILTVVSMLLDQKQSRDDSNTDNQNIKSKIPDLIKKLFKMTHTYTGESTELYCCDKGCRVLFYYCNEEDSNYVGTGINLKPFEVSAHDDFDDYSSDDFEIVEPENECEICGHNGKGCVLDSEKCFHGHEDEERGRHYLGKGTTMKYSSVCSDCYDINDCIHDCKCTEECKHVCGDSCYHSFCNGHEHWNCPGHFYVCCMGHTNITVNIKIMYIDEIINIIKKGYNIGESDDGA